MSGEGPRLYLLGGASRAGKSLLARRLTQERGVPYLSLDILMMGLANGVPEFGLDPDDSGVVRGEKLWPLLRAMCVNILETEVTYLFEGDLLLPAHAAELAREHGAAVRSCFLGYTHVSLEEKLHEIRTFRGGPNDWVSDSSDAYILSLIAEMTEFSRYLERECKQHRLPYIDHRGDFTDALQEAYLCLTAP
jgi:hypothetical protein